MTIWILAALLLRACLLGAHPFYEPRDAIADDRIVGVYADEDSGIVTTVSRTGARGHYRAVVQEGGSRSLYLVTLFKVGRRTFADVAADRAPAVRTPGTRTAPATELLATATAGNQHVVVRVALEKDGVSVWLPQPEALNSLWQREPHLRRTSLNQTASVVTEPTHTLRQILERYGQDDGLFSQEFWLAKRTR